MLARRLSPAPAVRAAITTISEAGLVLAIGEDERHASWEAVTSVVAGVAAYGDGEMFVLALNIDAGTESELFAVAESERLWPKLTTMLPIVLPKIELFERWGVALAQKAGVVTLYERPGLSNAS